MALENLQFLQATNPNLYNSGVRTHYGQDSYHQARVPQQGVPNATPQVVNWGLPKTDDMIKAQAISEMNLYPTSAIVQNEDKGYVPTGDREHHPDISNREDKVSSEFKEYYA